MTLDQGQPVVTICDAASQRERLYQRSSMTILVVALVLRAAWALFVKVVPVSDSNAYDTFARNIASGAGYGWKAGQIGAYWPVGTSAIYAALYRVFGVTYWPVVVLNTGLGLITVVLTMHLARRWFDQRTALLSGLMLALWPSQIEFTTVLASELPFTALVLAAFAAYPARRLTMGCCAAALLLAAASYIRPTALLLPGLLVGLAWLRGLNWRQALRHLVLMALLMGACLAPWTLRNYRLFGEPVLIATNGGPNFWMGNNPQTRGEYMELPAEVRNMTETQRDRYLSHEAWRYIRDEPAAFALRTATKLLRMHERESVGVTWNEPGLQELLPARGVLWLKLASNAYWWLALAAATAGVVGLVWERGRNAVLCPALLLWGYFAAIHAVTVIQDRYHFPAIPSIAMFAAFGPLWLAHRFWPQRSPSPTVSRVISEAP